MNYFGFLDKKKKTRITTATSTRFSDFFPAPNKKTWLWGMEFRSNEELYIGETEAYFEEFNNSYFLEGLRNWPKCWEKCKILERDYTYIEKKIEK